MRVAIYRRQDRTRQGPDFCPDYCCSWACCEDVGSYLPEVVAVPEAVVEVVVVMVMKLKRCRPRRSSKDDHNGGHCEGESGNGGKACFWKLWW